MFRIGLKMLVGDQMKYLGLLAGFFFTALMITQMTSLFVGMMSRSFTMVTHTTNADVWVMDSGVETVGEAAPMRETTLARVRGVAGVQYAMPMYLGNIRVRLDSGRFVNAELIGLDSATLVGAPRGGPPGEEFDWTVLRQTDSVVIDLAGAKNFLTDTFDGPNSPARPIAAGDTVSLNGNRGVVAGVAEVGARLIAKPVVYTTYERAVGWSPPQMNMLMYVLVRVQAGARPETVCRQINDTMPDLRARTRSELSMDSVRYTLRHTDVITQVGFMVLLTTTVGVIVSGLLLNMFISDNLRHFAALKAMGLTNLRIVGMLYVQTLWCGAIGCACGMGAACALGALMQRVNMPFILRWPAAVGIPTLILVLCLVAATLSARRVIRLEPGIVFRS